jgi:hypothetical protein
MATADQMARKKAAERKANMKKASNKARDRRVKEVGTMSTRTPKRGAKSAWNKVSSTRKMTTPKRGTRYVGVSKSSALKRKTASGMRPKNAGAEGPKRRSR